MRIMLARMDIYQMLRRNSFSLLAISILFAVVRQKSRFEGKNDNIHYIMTLGIIFCSDYMKSVPFFFHTSAYCGYFEWGQFTLLILD